MVAFVEEREDGVDHRVAVAHAPHLAPVDAVAGRTAGVARVGGRLHRDEAFQRRVLRSGHRRKLLHDPPFATLRAADDPQVSG